MFLHKRSSDSSLNFENDFNISPTFKIRLGLGLPDVRFSLNMSGILEAKYAINFVM